MRLIRDDPQDVYAIRIAAGLTATYGFCAMRVSEDGRCFIIPASDVVALTKKQQKEIAAKIEKLRKRKK